METFDYNYFPATYSTVHVALFTGVKNAPQIRRRLVAAATATGDDAARQQQAVDFAFVDAALLVSRAHLLTAIVTTFFSAYPMGVDHHNGDHKPKTRSHNLHSELLLHLSPNNNITESIRRHGVSDTTTSIAVVRFGSTRIPASEVFAGMERVVDGDLEYLTALNNEDNVDWALVDKVFKLGEMNQLDIPDLRKRKIERIINACSVKHVT